MAGIKSVQYGIVVVTNGQTTNSVAITPVNRSKSSVVSLGQSVSAGVGIEDSIIRLSLSLDGGNVIGTRAGSSQNCGMQFCVREYN